MSKQLIIDELKRRLESMSPIRKELAIRKLRRLIKQESKTQESVKQEELTQAGQRCKEQLSEIPLWAQRANGNNSFWNNLASSAFNIYN